MQEGRSTREGILEAAQSEFLEKGYQKAGLREIAARAGVTTGALYGYFKNKSELFEALVKESYDYMLDLYLKTLEDFFRLPPQQQAIQMNDFTQQCMTVMANYMYDHRESFKLMLCCAEGTPYSNLVHRMARLDVEATHSFAKVTGEAGIPVKPVNPTLEHMLTSGMFATFFELIVHDVPREEAGEYIRQMLDFYSAGWQKIMGY